ncbi:hypothetical protein [Nocardiopsis metallicus]|uniref:Uncharacterized protein n=1 Tax=Nocardiopsis metallicus TaxID=179819 RepID=A0A840WTE9_9ACTN|nr:hypothetical protein [Nocardiopsis metallicus]MBB5494876.1 hypothetical protein [Nocardiopsis metallicus]
MNSQPSSTPNPPFALLTVSSHPDRSEPLVGLSFHTGASSDQGHGPQATCHSYEDQDQAPILTVSQARSHATITPADPHQVSDADVRFAKELTMATLQYYEGVYRARHSEPSSLEF